MRHKELQTHWVKKTSIMSWEDTLSFVRLVSVAFLSFMVLLWAEDSSNTPSTDSADAGAPRAGLAGSVVIPMLLPMDHGRSGDCGPSQFVEVAYFAEPRGVLLFDEVAERVWWVQDRALLVLGSTGEPLPSAVWKRAQLYVQVYDQGVPLFEEARAISPQKQRVFVQGAGHGLQQSLSRSLKQSTSLDTTYLAEVANYLAGNLSTLNVIGSSYQVDGYGEVINASGQWVGEPVSGGSGDSPWTESSGNVYVTSDNVGVGTSSPDAKLQVEPTSGGQTGIAVDSVTAAPAILVHSGSNALAADEVGIGLSVNRANTYGVFLDEVNSPSDKVIADSQGAFMAQGVGGTGLFVGRADNLGVDIRGTGDDGIRLGEVGTPDQSSASADVNGVEIQGAQGHGLFLGYAGINGIHVQTAGNPSTAGVLAHDGHGVAIREAEYDGVQVGHAERNGFYVRDADSNGIAVDEAGNDGVSVGTTGSNGFRVVQAGSNGLLVEHADGYGVAVGSSGNSGIYVQDSDANGVHVNDASGHGVNVAYASEFGVNVENAAHGGVRVQDAGGTGVLVIGAGDYGVSVNAADSHGVNVFSPGGDGVHVEEADGDGLEVYNCVGNGAYLHGCGTGLRVDGTNCAARLEADSYSLNNPVLHVTATHASGICAYMKNTSNDTTLVLSNHGSGDIIRGFSGSTGSNMRFQVTNSGNVKADGSFTSPAADLAESFAVMNSADDYEPGDVMAISIQGDMQLNLASEPYSTRVAGVYATQPGVLLGPPLSQGQRIPLGVVGVIPTKVNTDGGPILPGDLLVTSSQPGVAMKADEARIRHGSLIGKALQPFDGAEPVGLIQVLVNVK